MELNRTSIYTGDVQYKKGRLASWGFGTDRDEHGKPILRLGEDLEIGHTGVTLGDVVRHLKREGWL